MKHTLFVSCLLLVIVFTGLACSDSGKTDKLETEITELKKQIADLEVQTNARTVEDDREIQTAQDVLAFVEGAHDCLTVIKETRNAFSDIRFAYSSPSQEAGERISDLIPRVNVASRQLETLYAPDEILSVKNRLRTEMDKIEEWLAVHSYLYSGGAVNTDAIADVEYEIQSLHTENARSLTDLKLKYEHILANLQSE